MTPLIGETLSAATSRTPNIVSKSGNSCTMIDAACLLVLMCAIALPYSRLMKAMPYKLHKHHELQLASAILLHGERASRDKQLPPCNIVRCTLMVVHKLS